MVDYCQLRNIDRRLGSISEELADENAGSSGNASAEELPSHSREDVGTNSVDLAALGVHSVTMGDDAADEEDWIGRSPSYQFDASPHGAAKLKVESDLLLIKQSNLREAEADDYEEEGDTQQDDEEN